MIARRRLPPLAYLEDKLSMHSRNVLPTLARRFPIVLVTTDTDLPDAPFEDVVRVPPKRYELQCGFEFARVTERLYRQGRIAFAYSYNCSGFALRRVPYLHVFGGSFMKNWLEYNRHTPWWRRAKWLPGFFHYVVPEIITARRAAIAVAKVEELKDDLVRFYRLRPNDVPVIPNGVGSTYLHLYRRKDFSGEIKVVFTGRLHLDKGIVGVAERLVRHTDIAAQFVIIGDGPEREAVARAAMRDSRIKLLGWQGREEISRVLATTQIFLFPGIIGGYSCSLLEGMASGHACIAYDLPGNREALRDAGFLEPLGNADAIWRRCAELSANRGVLREYAARAHARASDLSWDRFAERLSGVFLDMYSRVGFGPDSEVLAAWAAS